MIRRTGWLLAAMGLILILVASAPAFPRTQTPPAEAEGQGAPATGDSEAVETILREQEQLLRGQRFSYDPAGRRDPFTSLIENVVLVGGKRPKGIAGMLVAEVDLVGTIKDRSGGNIAFFMGSDNKGYFLRVGDAVHDGTLIAVSPTSGTVTFRQQVDDPRLIKPYRDVVKRLVPLEGMDQ